MTSILSTPFRYLSAVALSSKTVIFLSRIIVVAVLVAISESVFAQGALEDLRTWTSRQGSSLDAVLVGAKDDTVTLRDLKGKIYQFPMGELSQEDKMVVKQWLKENGAQKDEKNISNKKNKAAKRPLRRCRIAMDISSNCFGKIFEGDRKKSDAAVERILAELNRVWVPEAGIRFEIGNLEVRENQETDPYQVTRKSGELYEIGRRLNLKHKCDVTFILCEGSDFGGGLGGGRCVWINWTRDQWDVMHHEFSHAFGTAHGHGWPLERGTMNLAAQGSRYPRDRNHILNFVELEIIWKNTENLPEAKSVDQPAAPFAFFDKLHFKKPQGSSGIGSFRNGIQLAIDPLANDYDINGDEIRISGFDRKSVRGAKIEKSSDGHLRYHLESKFPQYIDYDFFHYTIVDEGGLESRGCVALFFDKAEKLVANGDFSKGKSAWQFEKASVVDNGEAVTSVKVDKRALIQPGGEIRQTIEFDGWLSESYVLEATLYCGPEKNESGEVLRPNTDPKMTIGLYGRDRKTVRQMKKKDYTLELPFRLARNKEALELRFTNNGEVPVRVGDVVLRPVD